MGELRQVTVVGDRTGGGSGNPKEVTLVVGGRDTGWKYSVPRWMEVRANGDVIEWQGITPDVVVPFDSASVARGTDPVLDWALARAAMPASFALPL
jgi:C-terminal processing protease CtpA/Prc